MASVSVVITSHNKHRFLTATLACLERQTLRPDEVIVIDDASDPPLADLPGVTRLVRREPPPHMQAARQLGITLAREELVLLTDDDCLVREDWVSRHVWRHQRDPGHLVVGSVRRIVYQGEREFWKLPPAPGVEEHRTFEQRLSLLLLNVPPWNLAPCSNNASVAREALTRVGGYDEAYRGWGVDDVDMTYRLMKDGVSLLIDSAAMVYHQEHPRSWNRQAEEETRNLWVFARRHGFWAYGARPPEFDGPDGYPVGGAWFHVQTILREGEPPAIRVAPLRSPEFAGPCEPGPLGWLLGSAARLPAAPAS